MNRNLDVVGGGLRSGLPSGYMTSKTLVLGMGNPILCDDGVGLLVAKAAAARCPRNDVAFAEASVGGVRLLNVIEGYRRVIMVDAMKTPEGTPGELHRLHPNDLPASLHASSTHDVSLPGALALGRRLGLTLPEDEGLVIIGIEVEDVQTFGEECTPAVMEAIPRAVEAVLAELDDVSPV
jgi:hydrogenase maturation protease